MVEAFSADKGSVNARSDRRSKSKRPSQPIGSLSTATPKKSAVKRKRKNVTTIKRKASHTPISSIKDRQHVKSHSTLGNSDEKRNQSRSNRKETVNRVNKKKRKQNSSGNNSSRRHKNKNNTPLSVSKKRRRNLSTKDKTGARSIEDDGDHDVPDIYGE